MTVLAAGVADDEELCAGSLDDEEAAAAAAELDGSTSMPRSRVDEWQVLVCLVCVRSCSVSGCTLTGAKATCCNYLLLIPDSITLHWLDQTSGLSATDISPQLE